MNGRENRILVWCLTATLAGLWGCSQSGPPSVAEGYRLRVDGRELTFEQQLRYLAAAMEIYRLHVGNYPSNENNLGALAAKPEILEGTGAWNGPYAESDAFFMDPWGKRLVYRVSEDGVIDLFSLGPDGEPGGDDVSARALFPDWFREIEKLPEAGPIPIRPASVSAGEAESPVE